MITIGKRTAALMILIIWQSDCLAAPSGHNAADERRVAHCIRQAAGGQKWLEVTLWGLRDQEGGWIGAAVPNRNGSHDLGPLQINSWWVPKSQQRLIVHRRKFAIGCVTIHASMPTQPVGFSSLLWHRRAAIGRRWASITVRGLIGRGDMPAA
jgi:hypothetical protein